LVRKTNLPYKPINDPVQVDSIEFVKDNKRGREDFGESMRKEFIFLDKNECKKLRVNALHNKEKKNI